MQERPIAVMIFGILNIGFGLLGLGDLLMPNSFESLGAVSNNPMLASAVAFLTSLYKDPTYLLWHRLSAPMEAAANLMLLASGIGLLLLKNWARLAALGCSIYRVIFALLNVAVIVHAVLGILAKDPQRASSLAVVIVVIASVVGFIFTAAYPILLLFFLTRPKILAAFKFTTPPASAP